MFRIRHGCRTFLPVTGACLLVKTSVWDEVKGLDEAFAVAFNDVDFCLRVRDAAIALRGRPTPS